MMSGFSSFVFAFILFLIISVVVTSFGSFLLRFFSLPFFSPVFFCITSFFFGYAFFMLFLFLLGLFSFYSLFALFFLLVVLLFFSYRDLFSLFSFLRTFVKKIFSFRSSFLSSFKIHHSLFLWVLLALFFLLNTVLTFFPFTEWDAVAYHLPLAQWYATTHATAPPSFLFHAQFPQLVEVLFGIGFLFNFSVGSFFVSFILFSFHHLLFLGIYSFVRHFYSPLVALYTLAIIYTLPEISIFITNPNIDIITMAYQFLAFFFIFLLLFTSSKKNVAYSFILLAFLFSGITAGIKYTGLFTVFFTLLAVLVYYFFLHIILDPMKINSKKKKHISSFLFFVFLALSLSSLFFLPFYLKNFYYTNNPVWPFLTSVFTHSAGTNPELMLAWNDYFVNLSFDKSNSLTFFLLPFYMTFTPSYFGSIYGIGAIFLLFCPIALYFMLSRKYTFSPVLVRQFFFYILTFSFFLFIWYKTQHSYRLLFFGFFLLAIIVAQTIYHLLTRFPSFPKFRFFIFSLFFLLLLSNTLAYFVVYRDAFPVFLFQEPVSYYRDQRVFVAPVDEYINTHLPEDAVILLANDLRGYYIQRSSVWGEPMNNMLYIDYRELDSAEEFYSVLQKKNIQYVRVTLFPQYNYTYGFYDKYYGEHITSLYSELFANHATLLYEENHVQLYSLR